MFGKILCCLSEKEDVPNTSEIIDNPNPTFPPPSPLARTTIRAELEDGRGIILQYYWQLLREISYGECNMKYKVHRLEINMEKDQSKLEQFLNSLDGEVVSIIPNNKKTSLLQIYGVTSKIDFLLIVERTN